MTAPSIIHDDDATRAEVGDIVTVPSSRLCARCSRWLRPGDAARFVSPRSTSFDFRMAHADPAACAPKGGRP